MSPSILSIEKPIATDSSLSSAWDAFKKIFQDFWLSILEWWNGNPAEGIEAEGPNFVVSIGIVIILLIATFIIEKISSRLNKRYGRKKEWADEVINGVTFMSRLFIIIIGVALVTAFGGIPDEYGLTITAITGAAIGIGATRSIQNIMSGFSVLFSRPIEIGDYVKIGDAEGVISEVTMSYTKLRTSKDRTILISNQVIPSKNIIKFGTDEVAKTYTIYPGFNHELTTKELAKIFKRTIDQFVPEQVIDIKYELIEVDRLGRKYEVSFVFDFVDDYFTIPSVFLEELMDEWDKMRTRKRAQAKK